MSKRKRKAPKKAKAKRKARPVLETLKFPRPNAAHDLGGRPSIFTQELADTICERISNGRTLRSVGRDPDLPCATTIRVWCRSRPDFNKQYEQARLLQMEHWADEAIDIADDGTNDYVEKQTRSGSYIALDREHVDRSRLRVDTRKWMLSRLLPQKYGNRLDMTNSDGSFSSAFAALIAAADGRGGQEDPGSGTTGPELVRTGDAAAQVAAGGAET